jgi:N-acetyl-anhydromuramyl-L-alanine amidase AmpD
MQPLSLNCHGSDVQRWQQALATRGFRVGIDGAFGKQTHNALLAFQAATGLPKTGTVGDAEWLAVLEPLPAPVMPLLADTIPLVECRYWTRGVTRIAIDWVVLHCMEAAQTATTAENCAHYLATLLDDEPPRSCHYFTDCDSVVQGVLEEHIAWHAPGANHNGIGIEHAGYTRETEADWLDDFGKRMLSLSAQLSAKICTRWNIPPVFVSAGELLLGRGGITTHAEVTKAWPDRGHGHMDPGDGFPMDWYLQRVDAALTKIKES